MVRDHLRTLTAAPAQLERSIVKSTNKNMPQIARSELVIELDCKQFEHAVAGPAIIDVAVKLVPVSASALVGT